METNRFPSIFPIRIPTRSGRRTPAGRTAFEVLSCAPSPFGSQHTYHTLRRKATDSSKEIEIFLKMLLLIPVAQNVHEF